MTVPEIPVAENFAFAFNTLLSDVAMALPDAREDVFASQVHLFETLSVAVQGARGGIEEAPLPQNTKVLLCQSTLPLLFGLVRSMGRFGSGCDFLLSRQGLTLLLSHVQVSLAFVDFSTDCTHPRRSPLCDPGRVAVAPPPALLPSPQPRTSPTSAPSSRAPSPTPSDTTRTTPLAATTTLS